MNNEDKNTENKSYNFINILLRSAMSFVGIAVLSMGAVFFTKGWLRYGSIYRDEYWIF